jgi:hypothetical protein
MGGHMPGEKDRPTATTTATLKPPEATARKGPNRQAMPAKELEEPGGSLVQLREILFGAAQRELERRLARIDAHLAARSQDLDQESRRRVEVLEAHVRKDTEMLTARLERELSERGDAVRAMGREHRESMSALEQRVARLEETLVHAQRDLRNQMLEQAKSFLDEIRRLRLELNETLEQELGLAEGAEEGGVGREEERTHP